MAGEMVGVLTAAIAGAQLNAVNAILARICFALDFKACRGCTALWLKASIER